MTREQSLRECLVSTAIGAAIAAILCAVLPDIERGLEMITFFLVFWFLGTYGTWTVIDIKDRVSYVDIKAFCHRNIDRIVRLFDAHGDDRSVRGRRKRVPGPGKGHRDTHAQAL